MSADRYEKVSPNKRYHIEDSPSRYGGTYERRTVEVKCLRPMAPLRQLYQHLPLRSRLQQRRPATRAPVAMGRGR